MKSFYFLSIAFIFLIKSVKCDDEYSMANDSNGTEKILSRRRRYLTFPEGSSVQLVYDQTLPTVSTKFYFTVAVTAALAWALPSEPFHKITQDFKDKLKSGELKRKDENLTNLIYSNSANPIIYEMNKHNYYYSSPPRQNENYNKNNRIDSASNYFKPNQTNFEYYLSNYLGNKNGNSVNYYTNKLKDISEATSPLKWSKSDWMDLVKTMTIKNKSKNLNKKSKESRRYLYPVFGRRKRSFTEENIIEKQHFQEHHRSTRHALYKKIKIYLSSKGLDGESCVLKSLCETKQKQSDGPGSIVSEIVKAVFTLPASHEKVTNEIHQRYDEAFSDSKNCIEQFPGCKESVWKADFIL